MIAGGPLLTWNCALNWFKPSAIVHRSFLPDKKTSGARKSFQAKKKWNNITEMIAGQDCGMMTEIRIRNGVAPSIIAASSNSRGRVKKYCRRRKTLYAFAK